MTKLEMMEKISYYRRQHENYNMGYFLCEHFANKLPKWVLEELLKHCDYKHTFVFLKEHIYTYQNDTYKHDFSYYVKLKKGFIWDTNKQVYLTVNNNREVIESCQKYIR